MASSWPKIPFDMLQVRYNLTWKERLSISLDLCHPKKQVVLKKIMKEIMLIGNLF